MRIGNPIRILFSKTEAEYLLGEQLERNLECVYRSNVNSNV